MMSLKSKCELLEAVQPRYLKANKIEKQKILDEFTSATGYHRKHAIRVLKNQVQVQNHLKGKAKTYKTIYRGSMVQALEQIWEINGHICSKRLQPYLPEAIKVLERCQEIELSEGDKELLLKISSASIDRCLRPIRIKSPHGLSTTKPGSLLKNLIPVRTFTEWDEERPGFMEIDLVAHCGNTTEGQYLNTLTCTDICTGWTDVTGVLHRSQEAVSEALQRMRQRLPFPLLGIDSDNGGEFINELLYRYCLDEKITFTRSRPYKRNDQAHVEQKNNDCSTINPGDACVNNLPIDPTLYTFPITYGNVYNAWIYTVAGNRMSEEASYLYNMTCPATTPFPCPANINQSCNGSGTQANFSWNTISGAAAYFCRGRS